ncbi:MAG: hypothetical protein AB1752_01630 [Candidatus Zixiibacteriota bacterium]
MSLPVGDIIRDAFKLAWKYKYLWLFGLFAAGGGSMNFSIPGGDNGSADPVAQAEAMYEWILAALAVIILVGLVVGTIILILHVISKSALIYNVYQIETHGQHSLSGGWDFGVSRFWPMLGLTLLEFLVTFAFVVVVVLAVIVFFVIQTLLGVLSLLFAIPILIAGIGMMRLTWNYADRFVTLETRGVIDALGEGWALMRREWRPSVTMLLVKIGIAIAVAMAVLGIGAMLILPAVGLWFVSMPLAIVYGVLVLLPFAVLIGAYFGTFDSTTWTKVFLHLRAPVYAAAQGAGAPPAPPAEPTPPGRESPPIFE